MRNFSEGVQFSYCALRPDEDLYQHTASAVEPPRKGFKSGPNTQIFRILEGFCAARKAVLVIEADCHPIHAGWLDAAMAEMALPEFFLCGSAYMGQSRLAGWAMQHINGNAIYATGREGFKDFVSGWWRPHVESHAEFVDPFIAYDVLPQKFFSMVGYAECRDSFRDDYRRYGHRFIQTTLILNYGGGRDEVENSPTMEQLIERYPRCHLVHGRYLRTAVLARLGTGNERVARQLKDIDAACTNKPTVRKASEPRPKEPVWLRTHLSNHASLRAGCLQMDARSNAWIAFIYHLPRSGPRRFCFDIVSYNSLPNLHVEACLAGESRLFQLLQERELSKFQTFPESLTSFIKAVEHGLWKFANRRMPWLLHEGDDRNSFLSILRFYRRSRSLLLATFNKKSQAKKELQPPSETSNISPSSEAHVRARGASQEMLRTKTFSITAHGRPRSIVAVFLKCRDGAAVIHLASRPKLRLR